LGGGGGGFPDAENAGKRLRPRKKRRGKGMSSWAWGGGKKIPKLRQKEKKFPTFENGVVEKTMFWNAGKCTIDKVLKERRNFVPLI